MSESAGLLSTAETQGREEGAGHFMGPCVALICTAQPVGKDYSKDTLRITNSAEAKSNFLGEKKRAT